MAYTGNRRLSRDVPPFDPNQGDKQWLDLQRHSNRKIMTPAELEGELRDPPQKIDKKRLDQIYGSLMGMALGDALGASVEFRPNAYLKENPVKGLKGGGTWGLEKGQFTDDTSMGLCLASSLVVRRNYVPYDQLVRYKWWHRAGYMSSTGECFDIGKATKESLAQFEERQKIFAEKHNIDLKEMDFLSDAQLLDEFDANCSAEGVAGNGALMRLAPVPLFFFQDAIYAVKCSGHSGEITHGDEKAYDACRYYGALIVAALRGEPREELIDPGFYEKHIEWFDKKPLHEEIMNIACGSYQKEGGYAAGIRGKGYIVDALEAALWALWSDGGNYETGVLNAVNLGDDTDTTAAIYGQLAGALYGFDGLPEKWSKKVYAKNFIECLSKWIVYEGENWWQRRSARLKVRAQNTEPSSEKKSKSTTFNESAPGPRRGSVTLEQYESAQLQANLISPELSEPKSNFRPRRNTIGNPEALLERISRKSEATSNLSSVNEDEPCSPTSDKRIYEHKNIKTCDDVCGWVESLGKDYKPYVKIFRTADINGWWLLNHLDENQLIGKGIRIQGHRQVILHRIEELKVECPVKYASSKK